MSTLQTIVLYNYSRELIIIYLREFKGVGYYVHWEETVSWPAVGSPRTGGLTKLSNYKADISTLYEKKLGEKK